MNKAQLIEHLSTTHAMTKAEAGRVLQTVLDAVVLTVKKGGSVVLPGFGSFKQVGRAARTGVNPATGGKIKIAASKAPKFTPGLAFKAAVDPKMARKQAEKKAERAASKPASRSAAKSAAKAPAARKAPVAAKKAAPVKAAPAKKAAAGKARKA
jgi:DNA-binding protein HU-beta